VNIRTQKNADIESAGRSALSLSNSDFGEDNSLWLTALGKLDAPVLNENSQHPRENSHQSQFDVVPMS